MGRLEDDDAVDAVADQLVGGRDAGHSGADDDDVDHLVFLRWLHAAAAADAAARRRMLDLGGTW